VRDKGGTVLKNKIRNWIIGIGCGDRHFKIGDVTYTVSSHFEPMNSENKINDRIKRTIINDFTPLTLPQYKDKMADEYVCSTAGEEDNNAVEEEI
jgi:hypothetical protein